MAEGATDAGATSPLIGAPPVNVSQRARVAIPFLIVTLIWSSTWLVIRGQFGVVPPAWSVTYRFAIATVVMVAYAAISGATLRLDWRQHRLALAYGVAQYALNYYGCISPSRRSPPGWSRSCSRCSSSPMRCSPGPS